MALAEPIFIVFGEHEPTRGTKTNPGITEAWFGVNASNGKILTYVVVQVARTARSLVSKTSREPSDKGAPLLPFQFSRDGDFDDPV